MSQQIPNWLYKRVQLSPGKVALKYGNSSWTFAELFRYAEKLAANIESLYDGDLPHRAAILMGNKPETIVVIHALQQSGIELVCLNVRLTADELTYQIKDSKADLLIYEENTRDKADIVCDTLAGTLAVDVSELMRTDIEHSHKRKEFRLQDVCTIMYTSGTTGKPKGVMQTYGNHWWSAIGSALNLGLREDDAWLCAMPLYHISGLSILIRSVIYGIPVILMEKFNEHEANSFLISGEATIMSVVSSMLSRMLTEKDTDSYHQRFRCMLAGGGPVPKVLLETCRDRGIPVFQTYGMTETSSQIATLSPEDSLRKLGSAGKALFPSELKVVNSQNGETSPHETGEILVKGPNVTSGYLGMGPSKDFQPNGWLATGDLGYKDDEGYLYVLDRRSDLIISGGENIYPAEIEDVLMAHKNISDAGVTGIPDETWGQVPYAFIVSEADLSDEDLLSHCQDRLASYKIPRSFIRIEELPRNSSNKLLRRELKKWIERK